MARALLRFSILLDTDPSTRGDICLYREGEELVWRLGGPDGERVRVMPTPNNVADAQADARAMYRRNGPWAPRARWL